MTQVTNAGTHAAQTPYLGNVLITESRKRIKNTKPNNILVLIGVLLWNLIRKYQIYYS
jgi:hypothetical protein